MPVSRLTFRVPQCGAAVLLMLALGASGCTSNTNSRTELGLAATNPHTAQHLVSTIEDPAARPEAPRRSDALSLVGPVPLDRSAWRTTAIVVPIDGVTGYPTYARPFERTTQSARQRGDFPTPVSALELGEGSDDTQWTEALAGPWMALTEGVLMLPRVAFVHPWTDVRHLPLQHWRAPAATPRLTLHQRTMPAATPTPPLPGSVPESPAQAEDPMAASGH